MKYALIAALLGSAGVAATTGATTLFDKTDANGNRVVIIDGGTSPALRPSTIDVDTRSVNTTQGTPSVAYENGFPPNRAVIPSDRVEALIEKLRQPVVR